MTDGVLVVGYGNALRTDDGFGWHAAERLADDPRFDGATVLQRHQLTPELALDVSRAALVVFIDVGHGPPPGTFTLEMVDPADSEAMTWTHRLEPSTLLVLARELYGRVPDAYVVRVGAASLGAGDRLSPKLDAAMPRVVEAVSGLISSPPARSERAPGRGRA